MGKFSKIISSVSVSVSVFILTLVFVIVAYIFLFGEIRATNRAISIKEDSISQASEQELRLDDLLVSVEETKEKRDALQKRILTDRSIVAFLEGIESLETQTGVVIEVRSIGKEVNENSAFVEELSLDINVEGSWEGVYHTFLLLETLPYKVRITRLQFNKALEAETGAYAWRGDFRLLITKTK